MKKQLLIPLSLIGMLVLNFNAKSQNVGIGTNTPTSTLDVIGTVKFENLATGTGHVLVVDDNGNVFKTLNLPKMDILVQKTWKVDEVHFVVNNSYKSFYNGGSNNTGVNYSNIRYTFNSNGTGTYIDEVNLSHTITWSFTTSDKRTMSFKIDSNSPDIWQMVEIADNFLHFTENFTVNSNPNCMISVRLIQIP